MGVLSKLTSSASMGLNLSTMMAKTMSLATFNALDKALQTSKLMSELAFGYVDGTVPMVEEVSKGSRPKSFEICITLNLGRTTIILKTSNTKMY